MRSTLEPLGKLGQALQTATFAERVNEADFEAYLAAAEGYESAVSAADAAAYLASTDYSARTSFNQGETPSTPNLDSARGSVEAAREALTAVSKLTRRL